MSDRNKKIVWEQFNEAFNWPEFSGRASTYLLASTGRSGSHFLAHQLFETGTLGSPFEYFHPKHIAEWQNRFKSDSVLETLEAIRRLRTSPSGWFGLKAHWHQFDEIMTKTDLGARFVPDHVIRLERRDKVAQAISMVIAKQTKAWISFHAPQADPVYDFSEIAQEKVELERQNAAWIDYISHIGRPYSVVFYEDLVREPRSVVEQLLDDMKLRKPEKPSGPRTHGPLVQASQLNMEWQQRFIRDLER